jgi:vacuolar protein sorting-associated protein 13A/C
LKTSAFDKFKLPFRIKFGKIARLKATVPWMSLSSSPVEIILDSLMVILVSKPKYEWEIYDQIGKNIKKEIINEFAEVLLDTLRKGESEEETENKGFVERLTMKILDNLQIKIRNIHIRYEVSAETNISDHTGFALGIKLDQLNIVTTDENWEVRFIDRTQEDNKGKPMLKLLELNQLSFYSDSGEK